MFRRTTRAGILILALVATACASGAPPEAEGPTAIAFTPTTVAPPVASGAGADATSEGIQVHGHWTIEVLDEDGSVAQSRVFDNELTDSGAETLARVLAGADSFFDDWQIAFSEDSGDCEVLDYDHVLNGESALDGSVVRLDLGGFPVPQDPSETVRTFTNVVSAVFAGSGGVRFTCHDIDPITVNPGDPVRVTLEISFS